MNRETLRKIFSTVAAGIIAGAGMNHLHAFPTVSGFNAEDVEKVKQMTLAEIWEALKPNVAAKSA